MRKTGPEDIACVSVPQTVVRCVPGEGPRVETETVQFEHTLYINVNGEPTLRVVCTPTRLFDLIVGRLYTQGIISGVEEVDSIEISEDGTRANVLLSQAEADFSKTQVETTLTTGSGNKVLNNYFECPIAPKKVTPIPWKYEWILTLAGRFAEDTPMHRATFGTHSCYLAREDEILFCCEDLGRHNAFDKVIGFALSNGIDLAQSIVFSSGRLPVDMVAKGIRAGIPILVSKAVPTALTIDLAKEYDLTLICSARPDGMNVFNDPIGVCS